MRQTLFWCAAWAVLGGMPALAVDVTPPSLVPPTLDPAACCDDWIVSARHCPEQRTGCQPCGLTVSRLDACRCQSPSSFGELAASLQPGVPVCVVIHGSFVDAEKVAEESRLAQRWLRQGCPGRPLHVVVFSWPSDQTSRLLFTSNVVSLGRRAERHAQDIARVIGQIPDDHPVCLVGHSHGARMVAATLHLLAGGQVDGIGCPMGPYSQHRIRAVLAAAAFDHEWFNPDERYGRAVYRAEGILNLRNRHDPALLFYPLHRLGAARALARCGLTRSDHRELSGWSAKVFEVDVTPYVGRTHWWADYLHEPAIAQIISPYVFFTDP